MKNILIASATTLVVGFFLGHVVFAKTPVTDHKTQSMSGMQHTMPDGTVMGDTQFGMSDMMTGMMNGLTGKTGDAFDRAFLAEMTVHHQGAVEMARAALSNAKHQEIKDLATAIISAQNAEIDQMESWYKNWYGTELK